MSAKIAEVLSTLINLLEPLKPEERKRAVGAALTALGDTPLDSSSGSSHEPSGGASNLDPASQKRTSTWLKQHSIATDQLESVFHIDGSDVDLITASIPGAKAGQKARNTYLLHGVARFLATGVPSFADQDARDECERYGFYDARNHTQYMKSIGNKLNGSKQKGWKLTGPGLAAAADLIKSM